MNEIILSAILFYSLLNDVDPKLTQSIMFTESSYNEKATGPYGEVGLMQIRPDYIPYPYRARISNTEENIALATYKLGRLKRRLQPRLGNAWFTAYNMGATGAIRASKKKDPTDFKYYKHVSNSYDLIFHRNDIKKYVIPFRYKQYKHPTFALYENKIVDRSPSSISTSRVAGELARRKRNFFFEKDPGAIYSICRKAYRNCGKGFYYEKNDNSYLITNSHVCLSKSVVYNNEKIDHGPVSYTVSNSLTAFSVGAKVSDLIYSKESDLCAIPVSSILPGIIKGMFAYKAATDFNEEKKPETVKIPIFTKDETKFKFNYSKVLGADTIQDRYSRKDSYVLKYHLKKGMSGLPILDENNRVKYIFWSSDGENNEATNKKPEFYRRHGKSYLIGGKALRTFFSKL